MKTWMSASAVVFAGAVLWTDTTGAEVESSPAVADGVVYVGWGHKVHAYRLHY